MRRAIREQLERKYKEMAEQTVGITASELQRVLEAVIGKTKELNPIEQKRLNEELEKERRRNLLSIELGRAEEETRWRKQNSCTHSRDSRTGNSVAKGSGEWTTCGQVHGDDTITLICLRCATQWRWKGTPQERDYAVNAGLLGMAPPPVERCINKEDFVERPKPKTENVAV